MHRLNGCFIELTGMGLSGRLFNTAATNTGPGIWATANNTTLTVTDTRIDSVAYDGIYSGAAFLTVTGCDITDTGRALTANRRNGVRTITGVSQFSIVGGSIGHRSGGTTMEYCGYFAVAGVGTMMGVAFITPSVGFVTGYIPNLLGCTAGGHFVTTAGLVLGIPTGVDKGAGTLNAAGDLYKNNTAFTNP